MSNISGTKALGAILSIAMFGALGTVSASAQNKNVTTDQIIRALAPEKKPLTRGLSVGPQTTVDPAAAAAEGKFVQKIRGRSTRSLSVAEREEIAAIVKDKPNIDLEINFDYNSADISAEIAAVGSGARQCAHQCRPQRLDLRGRGPHRRGGRRRL